MAVNAPSKFPLVVLAEPKSRTAAKNGRLDAVVDALCEDGKEALVVTEPSELAAAIQDPRCLCVFVRSDFVSDILGPIRASRRNIPSVEWFILMSVTDRRFSYRANEAGVKGILLDPVTPFQYVQRARQVLGLTTPASSLARRPLHASISNRPAPMQEPEPQDLGIEFLRGGTNYSDRRPQWVQLEKSMRHEASFPSTMEGLKSHCELCLLDLVRTERRARASLLSVRPTTQDLLREEPRKVRTLVSSDLLDKRVEEDMAACPEVSAAFRSGQAVAVPDVRKSPAYRNSAAKLEARGVVSRVAVPLYREGKVFGVMRLEFSEPVNPRLRALVEDVVPIAEAFVPAFAKIDFLARIYNSAGIET